MTATIEYVPVGAPADHVGGAAQGQWTYTTYAAVPDDGQRYEVMDGILYTVPTRDTAHQAASALIATYLMMHVQIPKLGCVYTAPFDVELAPNIVVQPDVLVVLAANQGIITPSRIIGAPDLIVEIASPSTATYDRSKKLRAYEQAGVQEFWIADPQARNIEVLLLDQNGYRSQGVFAGQATLPSRVVPGLPVQVQRFFV